MSVSEGARPVLRSETVYGTLRQEITDGVLAPGTPLVEDDIAERLGVSRTPVRESIQRLAADGLVDSRRRRWIVHAYQPEEISEIYGVRAALESHAARLAALNADGATLERIEARREVMTRENLITLVQRGTANDEFHDLISGASGNPRLLRTIRDQRLFHFNRHIGALYDEESLRTTSRQHGQLIDAVCARDADGASEIARIHVEFSLQLLLDRLF